MNLLAIVIGVLVIVTSELVDSAMGNGVWARFAGPSHQWPKPSHPTGEPSKWLGGAHSSASVLLKPYAPSFLCRRSQSGTWVRRVLCQVSSSGTGLWAIAEHGRSEFDLACVPC